SEGRPLQLLWEMFDLKIHFFERVLLKKLAEGQTPRKGKWAAGVVVKQAVAIIP
ncbi:hypothetical protein GT022_20330, partial [Agaribacter marinus]|nr:hypothetical protein [Agaribacter marinus]